MSKEGELDSLFWAIETYLDFLADGELEEVYTEIQKSQKGELKCGCVRCLNGLATRANQIADWLSKGTDPVRWYVHPKGILHWYLDESGEVFDKLEGGE